MDFNYTREPDIVATAAQNPNGSWTIALLNLTGIHSQHYASYYDPAEGRPYEVRLRVEELSKEKDLVFAATHTSGVAHSIQPGAAIRMKRGMAKVMVKPMELVVLRSRPAGMPK
jgi:hypothetical protein